MIGLMKELTNGWLLLVRLLNGLIIGQMDSWSIGWLDHFVVDISYSGKSPLTLARYVLVSSLFRICCSISWAFDRFLANINRPDVRRSKRWIALK